MTVGFILIFGTLCFFFRISCSSKYDTRRLSSKFLSVSVVQGKSDFELLEASSVINQIERYCLKNKIHGWLCELAFVRTLQICYQQKIVLTIPLYDLYDDVTRNCTEENFNVTLFGGPVYSQIDTFCSLNKCSNTTRDHIVKKIHSHGGYWFPLADIMLYKASANQSTSSSSIASSKSIKTPIEPGWISMIEKFNTTMHKRRYDFHRLDKSRPHRRVFYGIFAGRLDQMPIHLAYTDLLLDAHLVTEVHIWDFTTDLNDTEYLSTFVRNSPRGGYHLFKRPYNENDRGSLTSEGYLFHSFYRHYLTNKRYRADDIIIKADDDIVFIDISRFDSFVNNISNKHLYFPNIVNNDVGLVIQANRNAHPSLEFILRAYQAQGSNLTSLMSKTIAVGRKGHKSMICPLTAIYCDDLRWHIDAWRQALFQDGIAAKLIHDAFLEDPLRFIEKSQLRGERYVEVRRRISINLIAGRASYIRTAFGKFLKDSCCDDEGFVGLWPFFSGDSHVIDTHFTIAHFAFSPQRRFYDGNMSDDLARYAAIVNFLTTVNIV